jgi:hypothetical protein
VARRDRPGIIDARHESSSVTIAVRPFATISSNPRVGFLKRAAVRASPVPMRALSSVDSR